MPQENTEKKVFSPKESRQGFKGSPVLIILVISLVLAGAVWIVAESWGESTAPATTETPPATSSTAPSATPNPGAQGGGTFDNNPPSGSTPPTEGTDKNPSSTNTPNP